MGANIHYYFLKGNDINFIQMFLSRTLGSPLKEDENGHVNCVNNYATFVLNDIYQSRKNVQQQLDELSGKESSNLLKRKLNQQKNLNELITSFERKKEKIEKITGKKRWEDVTIAFDYHNLYLSFDNSYVGQGSIYYHNQNDDEIRPKEKIAGYMSLGMNLKWAFLSDKMVDFFGGKVIFYDGGDFDDPKNFKLVEKHDAICKLEVGDFQGNFERFSKALKEIKAFDEEDVIKFAESRGYGVSASDDLMLMLPYQSKLIKEEMQKDLGLDLKSSNKSKSVKKIVKF